MDPSRVVRTIPNSAPLPFDVPSTFKTHPFKRLLCRGGPGVISAIESIKSCPLIVVLDLNVTPRGLISMTYFIILLMASSFYTMVLKGYSVSTTIGKY